MKQLEKFRNLVINFNFFFLLNNKLTEFNACTKFKIHKHKLKSQTLFASHLKYPRKNSIIITLFEQLKENKRSLFDLKILFFEGIGVLF